MEARLLYSKIQGGQLSRLLRDHSRRQQSIQTEAAPGNIKVIDRISANNISFLLRVCSADLKAILYRWPATH